jgi:LysR family transcriptional regulator, regulator for metE and metH
MPIELRHLKLIVAISKEKSVTKAGDRRYLTQSVLSRQLKDIESRLKTQLFLRVDKKMQLTPGGKRLLKSARLIISKLEQAQVDISYLSLHQPKNIKRFLLIF